MNTNAKAPVIRHETEMVAVNSPNAKGVSVGWIRPIAALLVIVLGLGGFDLTSAKAQTNGTQEQTEPGQNNSQIKVVQMGPQFTDPRTGTVFQYKLLEFQMPTWQWATTSQQTTQTQYVPVTNYELQSRIRNRWNPFAIPRVDYEYVRRTNWAPQSVPVTQNVPYQRIAYQTVRQWFAEPVTGSQPAPATAANSPSQDNVVQTDSLGIRSELRTAGGNARPSANRGNPSQLAANQALANRNRNSVYQFQPIGSVPNTRWQTASSPGVFQSASAAGNSVLPAGSIPLYTPNPAWNAQPVFASRPLARGVSTVGRTVNAILRPSTSTQNLPQTASLSGSGVYRDSVQTGMNATVLR